MNSCWFLQVTVLVHIINARKLYPIIEYSYEDEGSGMDTTSDTYNEHNTHFLMNVIQKGKSLNKNAHQPTTIEELQLLNRDVKLSMNKPSQVNITQLPNESIKQLQVQNHIYLVNFMTFLVNFKTCLTAKFDISCRESLLYFYTNFFFVNVYFACEDLYEK